jgi:hypothetical protein
VGATYAPAGQWSELLKLQCMWALTQARPRVPQQHWQVEGGEVCEGVERWDPWGCLGCHNHCCPAEAAPGHLASAAQSQQLPGLEMLTTELAAVAVQQSWCWAKAQAWRAQAHLMVGPGPVAPPLLVLPVLAAVVVARAVLR